LSSINLVWKEWRKKLKQCEQKYDIAVFGGGLGGIMAAISAAKSGKKVLLTEETDWIGGQLTSQCVPADEHKWVESTGCTSTYQQFRKRVRAFYKEHFPISDAYKDVPALNPGMGFVSRITNDPRVSLHVLYEMLLPFLCNGQITLLLNTKAVAAERDGRNVKSVTICNGTKIIASYFIDATETGYLLPLTNTAYRKGAEAKSETGEPHALEVADPDEMQPVTWVAAADFVPGGNFVIEKPAEYEYFKNMDAPFSDSCKVLSWYGPGHEIGQTMHCSMFGDGGTVPLWHYRRIAFNEVFKDGFMPYDATLINWPQNDYFMDNIFDTEDDEKNLYMAKQLTLSFIYWLQTEAPRHDGGSGYPEIRMRGDITGTADGLAKAPYIREGRRIIAEHTILEQHITENCNTTPPTVSDSIGVGCYRMDLHMTTRKRRHFYQKAWPFEIPLGALIPKDTDNLLPACKNIGTTQLTNGSFREHPTEWNIGESVGYLAAFALDKGVTPSVVRNTPELLKAFQQHLEANGIVLHWDHSQIEPV